MSRETPVNSLRSVSPRPPGGLLADSGRRPVYHLSPVLGHQMKMDSRKV